MERRGEYCDNHHAPMASSAIWLVHLQEDFWYKPLGLFVEWYNTCFTALQLNPSMLDIVSREQVLVGNRVICYNHLYLPSSELWCNWGFPCIHDTQFAKVTRDASLIIWEEGDVFSQQNAKMLQPLTIAHMLLSIDLI